MATARPVAAAAPVRRRRSLAPYLFMSPGLVLFVAFLLVPMCYALWLSLRGFRVSGPGPFGVREETFVGLDNYVAAVTSRDFLEGFGRLAVYGLIAVPLTLGLALLFALLLDATTTRAKRFSRTAIFVPYAVPGVIASLLWGFLYLPTTSPFSDVTQALGLGTIPFLSGTSLYGSVANIAIWGGVGFNMIIIYTSLRGIPVEIQEAARIDGASELQVALRVKVPLVVPALVLTGLFALIGTLQVYGEPTTLQPMTTSISQTWVPLMTIYRDAFTRDDLPLAAAASVLLAVGTLVVSVLLLRTTQRRAFGEG
ncbi:sugar ABC transporter permease [Paenibacillus sp. TRM 82003]|uniref:carbohydrate ABC transporter permease n=1 Tax=Kineococcus sp. TRM81007 TaxID=2925831 RepID=UPI001F5646AF|nr:sugar ABC transporter permease [Kineococcus sp. TRM81007]MCI2238933.1 sugar ABC transporter permease [Kineococcus sp. TRM81007]MCI3924352.1 sugar ABC transporter permease [Paenibacillus sp. TRM 82003]